MKQLKSPITELQDLDNYSFVTQVGLIFLFIILHFILITAIINCTAWFWAYNDISPISDELQKGFILKFDSINYAVIMAHGDYRFNKDGVYQHTTFYEGELVSTYDLTKELNEGETWIEGYSKIWISMCRQGNHDFIVLYPNGTKIKWPDYIDRVERPGDIYPIFIGGKVWRIVI